MMETQAFVTDLFETAKESHRLGRSLKQSFDATRALMDPKYGSWVIYEHCMLFDVARAYDEADRMVRPRIWTAERDQGNVERFE